MIGQTWLGWRVRRQLGQGGMGTAYLAERQGQKAVLKLPARHVSPQEHQIECRNLYLAASLGVAPSPIIATPQGILMEYLPVPTAMPLRERARQLLGNINKLHNRELVHRDIKPANIIGTQLVDLGAMVDLVRDRSVALIGTPGYAAPEAYTGTIAPSLDAYAVGWALVEWLGGPEPDPKVAGPPPPQQWQCPHWWIWILDLLAPEPSVRASVGQVYAFLSPEFLRIPSGAEIGKDLVTAEKFSRVMGQVCDQQCGYATNLEKSDIRSYCYRMGVRLPTLAELQELAQGTERQQATRSFKSGLVSDWGAKHSRRFLWQPTVDGHLFGGTAYADQEVLQGWQQNQMVGLRVVKK